jgi:hypothetical protein
MQPDFYQRIFRDKNLKRLDKPYWLPTQEELTVERLARDEGLRQKTLNHLINNQSNQEHPEIELAIGTLSTIQCEAEMRK